MQNFVARDMPAVAAFFTGATDEAGLLYFCNGGTIVRYNGAEWERFRPTEDALNLRGLAFGPDRRLYLGGANVLGRLTLPERKFESLLDRLPEAERAPGLITQIVSHAGAVHFVGAKQVFVWRDEQFTLIPCMGGRLHVVGDALYLTALKTPLRRIDRSAVATVSDDPVFRAKDIRLIGDGGDGSLIVGPQQGGFYRLTADRSAPLVSFPTTADEVLRKKQIYTARQLSDGSIALAFTITSGGTAIFLRRDGQCLLQLDEATGLQNPNVQGFLPDRDGGLWLSLADGLARVQWPGAFTYFQRANGFEPGAVRSMLWHEGTLYLSNTRGLYRLDAGQPPGRPARFERVFTGEPRELKNWRGGVLIAAWEDVRWLRPAGDFQVIYKPDGTVRATAAEPSQRDPNRLWIATTEGVRSLYFSENTWRDEGLMNELKGLFTGVIEDTDGTLWCTGPGLGFVRARFGAEPADPTRPAVRDVRRFVEGSGLPAPVAAGRVSRWNGDLLFTSSGGQALLRFNRDREVFESVPDLKTLAEPTMTTVGVGHPDRVWLAVDRLSPKEWRLVRSDRGGALQALPQTTNQPLAAAYVFLEQATPEGDVLWVGGIDAIMRVDLGRAFTAPSPLVVHLRAADFSAGARRTPEQRDVEFEYFAPRYQTGAAVEYQTRLVGYESEWSAWTAARKRAFTNLPAGRYTYLVRARDTDQVESVPAELAFAVLPSWWRTWWFMGLAGAAGVGSVAGITRWFATRALQRRLALLEAQSAVERERLRLARDLHDEVGSGLGRVILFAGEARRNKSDPVQLDASLERVRDSAQALVQHAREIVWAVSPQHDTLHSVIERFGDYVDETLRAAGITCRLEVPPAAQIPPVTLGSDARHSLFLAVKEAVHNCVKYSEAKTAEFRLEIAGNDFVITLRDRGRGFAAGERRGSGHGTKNLIARAKALGGSGEIIGVPGQGTTVRLRVPLAASRYSPTARAAPVNRVQVKAADAE